MMAMSQVMQQLQQQLARNSQESIAITEIHLANWKQTCGQYAPKTLVLQLLKEAAADYTTHTLAAQPALEYILAMHVHKKRTPRPVGEVHTPPGEHDYTHKHT